MISKKILCVDDDEKVLNGIQRQQEDRFEIETAVGPLEALAKLDENGPFAIVLSDMRMPEMNGVELLSRVRHHSPHTVRMILSGYADLDSTIAAVNQGHIFRFLSKPCDGEDLAAALDAGLRQFQLLEAERELVEGTLHGCVQVLSEVLSLVNPLAFGQSTRIRKTVDGILKRLSIENQWQVEIAAMLSELGCVTLPGELLEKRLAGSMLEYEEAKTFAAHPKIAGELIRSIPRLDRVAEIISSQNVLEAPYEIRDPHISFEGQILQIALDYDMFELDSESSLHALAKLKEREEEYEPEIFDALSDYVKTERNFEYKEVAVHQIRRGMVLAQNIKSRNGTLLMSKGQEITNSANRLLANFSQKNEIQGKIRVVICGDVKQEPVYAEFDGRC